MPIPEFILGPIVDAVVGYAVEQGRAATVSWVRDKAGLDPVKRAYKRALNKAVDELEAHHPQANADLFDYSFFQYEGAPILAQFLIRDGRPDPSTLAARWADSLNMRSGERRTTFTRKLEPVAADFLDNLAHALKAEQDLKEINDSRALEQLTEDLTALRSKLGAEHATPGTRRDYLRWLMRHLYLDSRGTMQTQRHVQVKLDEVYISLQAQREETPGAVDRKLLEQELAELETKLAAMRVSAEDAEDQRENLLALLGRRDGGVRSSGATEPVELADVVNKHDRVVVLGDPGSGKTTLLRYLALKHAQALWNGSDDAGDGLGSPRFPILIRIAEYAQDGTWKNTSLSGFLATYYTTQECPTAGLADLLATELVGGNCLIMLDGLDEIVSADDRRGIVERIENFVRRHDNQPNRFVVTSRVAGYRTFPLSDPFAHYAVQEMNEVQMQHFLERWCKAVEAAQTPDLSQEARDAVAQREIDGIMRAIKDAPGVRRMATNPLLLRVLALIHRTGAQLPQKRIELYKLAADTLARTWRTAQGVSESALVEETYLTRLLGRLAYWLHVNKPTGIATESEVYKVLGKAWIDIKGLAQEVDDPDVVIEVEKFLQAVRVHTGLFVERAPKRYGFMHLTFEEYYAARHLVSRSKTRAKLIRQHLHDPRWDEPILLGLGFVGLDTPEDAEELVEVAILAQGEDAENEGFAPSVYEDLLSRDFLFALRCLGDDIPIDPKLVQKLIQRLVDEWLHRIGSGKYERRRQALRQQIRALERSSSVAVLVSLFTIALNDDNIWVRLQAVDGLRWVGQTPPAVHRVLTDALKSTDPFICLRAIDQLTWLKLLTTEDTRVLLSMLDNSDAKVRGRAITMLLTLPILEPEQKLSVSTQALKDSSEGVRLAATINVAVLAHKIPEAMMILIDIAERGSLEARFAAFSALIDLHEVGPKTVALLVQALKDPDLLVRHIAVIGLTKLEQEIEEQVIPILVRAMWDDEGETRLDIATSLLRSRKSIPEAVEVLTTALDNNDANMQLSAACTLAEAGQMTSKVVVPRFDGHRVYAALASIARRRS